MPSPCRACSFAPCLRGYVSHHTYYLRLTSEGLPYGFIFSFSASAWILNPMSQEVQHDCVLHIILSHCVFILQKLLQLLHHDFQWVSLRKACVLKSFFVSLGILSKVLNLLTSPFKPECSIEKCELEKQSFAIN